jgi:hypothetical protein
MSSTHWGRWRCWGVRWRHRRHNNGVEAAWNLVRYSRLLREVRVIPIRKSIKRSRRVDRIPSATALRLNLSVHRLSVQFVLCSSSRCRLKHPGLIIPVCTGQLHQQQLRSPRPPITPRILRTLALVGLQEMKIPSQHVHMCPIKPPEGWVCWTQPLFSSIDLGMPYGIRGLLIVLPERPSHGHVRHRNQGMV